MRTVFKIILALLFGVFYMPFVIIYITSVNRLTINRDLDVLNKKYGKKGCYVLSLLYYIMFDDYFKTIFLHRTRKQILSRVLYKNNKYNFCIPFDVELGEYVSYDHPYGTILNAKSIGNNFSFKHLTTIGNKNDDEDLRPVILDNVVLGANVTIIGNITIGNNVTIGAGTVVTKSIPDNSIVVGSSFRQLNRSFSK